MNKRTRENLLYMGEELLSRLKRPVLFFYLCVALGAGLVWGFQRVDAYLTPSYRIEEEGKIATASIVIPKINVKAPIAFVDSTNPDDFLEPLKQGVAHFPSALPGEQGVSVLLGHSSPFGWLRDTYDDVFSNLNELEVSDRILITMNGTVNTYKVSGKVFLNRGQDIPLEYQLGDGQRILLISCWPPGIDNKRIIIQAEAA